MIAHRIHHAGFSEPRYRSTFPVSSCSRPLASAPRSHTSSGSASTGSTPPRSSSARLIRNTGRNISRPRSTSGSMDTAAPNASSASPSAQTTRPHNAIRGFTRPGDAGFGHHLRRALRGRRVTTGRAQLGGVALRRAEPFDQGLDAGALPQLGLQLRQVRPDVLEDLFDFARGQVGERGADPRQIHPHGGRLLAHAASPKSTFIVDAKLCQVFPDSARRSRPGSFRL